MMEQEEQPREGRNYLLPGERMEVQLRPIREGELEAFMQGLPPWFTEEMLSPGVPITLPKGGTSTVALPGGTLREREPGAWQQQRVGEPEEKRQSAFRLFVQSLVGRKR